MSDFSTLCRSATERFLKTVTIIDDDAIFEDAADSGTSPNPSEVIPPANALMQTNTDSDIQATTSSHTETSDSTLDTDKHFLNATEIINAFSEHEILCCVQRYDKEQSQEIAIKLAKSSDVFIIDWDLKKDKNKARDIIKTILENDILSGGRIRLIIVYTAQNYVKQMLNDIGQEMNALYKKDISIDNDNFCIVYAHTKIVVFNKEQTPDTSDSINKVSFSQLPDSVITQFSELVKGLIPCATLNIIAAMREQTHKLLSIFNRSLDAPFVHHSLHADDDFAMKLITGEIETILQGDEKANEMIGKTSIDLWLDNFSTNREEIAAFETSNGEKSKSGRDEKPFCKKTVGEKRASLWDKLSHIQCTTRDNFARTYIDKNNAPTLSFGTVLEENNTEKKYYICLHPPCDSIRLTGPTEFIFACLYESKNYTDIIIQTKKEEFIKLALKTDTTGSTKIRVRTINFTPTTNKNPIYGTKEEEEWHFKSSEPTTTYRWLGEVRREKAIALKQRAMANANREGFDEFTWLRLRASSELKPYFE